MNTGLQDAYNLAWKMALVIHGVGWADGAAGLVRGGAEAGGAVVVVLERELLLRGVDGGQATLGVVVVQVGAASVLVLRGLGRRSAS